MTDWELSFLCGLIREKKPKKIMEIGVASGGTTVVILNCIDLLRYELMVYSIDINERLYSDNSKMTGYIAEQGKLFLKKSVENKLYTGGFSIDFLDDIGDDIDFLIIDTMHIWPGELLDFLACLPYLKNGATVVLHDIVLHHKEMTIATCATQIILNAVVAEKI